MEEKELKEDETMLIETDDYITCAYDTLHFKRCVKCGAHDLLDERNYCSNCGRKIVN